MKDIRTKYYVASGDLEMVVMAENSQFAALDAYVKSRLPRERLDLQYFYVDQRGFRNPFIDGLEPMYKIPLLEIIAWSEEELS